MGKHCRGCIYLSGQMIKNAPKNTKKQYDEWCCIHGQLVKNSIGWCKTHNAKSLGNNHAK